MSIVIEGSRSISTLDNIKLAQFLTKRGAEVLRPLIYSKILSIKVVLDHQQIELPLIRIVNYPTILSFHLLGCKRKIPNQEA